MIRPISYASRLAALAAAVLLVAAPAIADAALPTRPVRVVATYPHDTDAFTEGLLYRGGYLYESTGRSGQSYIRKVELKTGKVLASVTLPSGLFGEGIVDWGDQLVSVTWRSQLGFRWSLPGFRQLGQFRYAGEGWALTQDGKNLILSDGTPVLRFLDPRTLQVVRRLKVTAEGVPLEQINELEYVKGEILANVWLTNKIARIDPRTGAVKGWIDVSALARRVGLTDPDAVPNGIAYDKAHDRLFVTGKLWPLLFEVKY